MAIELQTKRLTKQFDGVKAINKLSLDIERGRITGIIGPNGSGKTTLINVLTGMVPIDEGAIVVGGEEIKEIKPHDVSTYGMTRTFQTIRLFEQMTVLDNLLVVLTERGVGGALFEKHGKYHISKARELLKQVDLWKKKNDLAVNLSYGQRKLLEIVRAVAMDAQIYFLDEPFSGLFPEIRKTIIDIVQQLKEKEKTIVLIEHDMVLIRELADYVVVLDEGKILAEGAPEKVLSNKKVIEAYLGD